MTYRDVYKMVKRSADRAAKKPVKEPQYGVDYLTKATGRKFPKSYKSISDGLPFHDQVLYNTQYQYPQFGTYQLKNTGLGGSSPITTADLDRRMIRLQAGVDDIYDFGSRPNELLRKDLDRWAKLKRLMYDTTGEVDNSSRVYRPGNKLPSGLLVTPQNVDAINRLFRQSASTNRPSSVYKPA